MQSVGVQVYGRVDFRLDPENKPWCLEINTLPGMTETSLLPMGAAAIGLSFPQLIDEILKLSLNKYS
jgi:D-alanine-D-alanine ligase